MKRLLHSGLLSVFVCCRKKEYILKGIFFKINFLPCFYRMVSQRWLWVLQPTARCIQPTARCSSGLLCAFFRSAFVCSKICKCVSIHMQCCWSLISAKIFVIFPFRAPFSWTYESGEHLRFTPNKVLFNFNICVDPIAWIQYSAFTESLAPDPVTLNNRSRSGNAE